MTEKNDNQLITLLTKLIKETKNGELTWESDEAPRFLTEGTDHVIQNYFHTNYKGRILAIFHRRFKQYSGEFDVFYWSGETKFAIVEKDKVLWENDEYIPAVYDLYNYVRKQASGLTDLLNELI